MTFFRTETLSVRYGGVRALEGVSLEVSAGQLVGLIGPNGAGKTTFIDAVTGFTPAFGLIAFDGLNISNLSPHVRARRGLARTWQAGELFDDLTVRENLAVTAGSGSLHRLVWRQPRAEIASRVEGALAAVGLEDVSDVLPLELSLGQRKLVGVARALASRPKLICLDEPAAGLDSAESAELGRRLRAVVDAGTSLLLVDHDMSLVMGVCDHVFVLNFGELIAAGPPETVRATPEVVAAYLGSSAAEVAEAIQ